MVSEFSKLALSSNYNGASIAMDEKTWNSKDIVIDSFSRTNPFLELTNQQ